MYNTYDNYTAYPSHQGYSSYDSYPSNIEDYSDYPNVGIGNSTNYTSFDDDGDRFIAPLLAPFLLGGLAGAAVAPYFYRPGCCYPGIPPYPPMYPPAYYPPYGRYY